MMRWRGREWPVRLMGCLFGLGSLGLGLTGLFADSPAQVSEQAGRLDFSLIAIVTGLIALLGSLLTRNIRDLWFCTPERSKEIGKRSGETIREMLFGSDRKR